MPIAVTCECGKRFNVKDEFAGKRGKCPLCGHVLLVPTPEPDTGVRDEPEPPAARARPERPARAGGAPAAAGRRHAPA